MRSKLIDFQFEKGCCLIRSIPSFGSRKFRRDWHVIGRLKGGTAFLLRYSGVGVTQWQCETVLGQSLRKKILDRFREEVRRARAQVPYITPHDLRAADEQDFNAGSLEAGRIMRAFVADHWRSAIATDPAPAHRARSTGASKETDRPLAVPSANPLFSTAKLPAPAQRADVEPIDQSGPSS